MAIRTFMFCDFCNPGGTRCIEQRRDSHRGNRTGRRISDSRVWFEGSIEAAASDHGWLVDGNVHICPDCRKRQSDQHVAA